MTCSGGLIGPLWLLHAEQITGEQGSIRKASQEATAGSQQGALVVSIRGERQWDSFGGYVLKVELTRLLDAFYLRCERYKRA